MVNSGRLISEAQKEEKEKKADLKMFLEGFGGMALGPASAAIGAVVGQVIEAAEGSASTDTIDPDCPDGSANRPDGSANRPDGSANSPFKVDHVLDSMPSLSKVIAKAKALDSGAALPFEGVSLFLVQHLTVEILGTIAALRELGCKDLVTVFVGYNPDAEKKYSPSLNDLPKDEFRCFILKSSTASSGGAQGIYSVKQDFPQGSTMDEADVPLAEAMNTAMAEGTDNKAMDFLQAMRCLCVTLFLQQLAKAKTGNKELMIIEGGGYLNPIINDAALGGKTVAELRAAHRAPEDPDTDAKLDSNNVKDALEATMLGTVEHTRNGYDRNVEINRKYGGKLCRPAFSIAVSHLKTIIESDIVASTILNAVTSAIYSHGYVLERRNVLVLGSRGNIGRRIVVNLTSCLDQETGANGEKLINLIGCDLKVDDEPTSMTEVPEWLYNLNKSSVPNSEENEKGTLEEFGKERVREVDVILGITGHSVLQVEDIQDWLLRSKKENLFLASGSTKTAEFPEILEWMDELLSTAEKNDGEVYIDGKLATLTQKRMKDKVSGRDFGGQFVFAFTKEALEDGSKPTKSLLFLNNLLPVNFMFYGVPTEVIEEILAQLVDASVSLRRKAGTLTTRLYAVDYDIAASEGIFKSKVPARDLPLP